MADAFVSAFFGNDSNDGLTVANAKATMQAGVGVIGNGDTVFVYPGLYNEAIDPSASISIGIEAVGKVIMDGENTLGTAITPGAAGNSLRLDGFEIKNYTLGVISRDQTFPTEAITNNFIHGCVTGIEVQNNNGVSALITSNVIYDCTTAISVRQQINADGVTITSNTFHNCDIALGMSIGPAVSMHVVKNNIFSDVGIAYDQTATSGSLSAVFAILDNNMYNLSSGQNIAETDSGVNTFTTLASWKTLTGKAVNSQEADPLFANSSKGIFSLLNNSPAASGSDSASYVGARRTEVGWYNAAILQSGATLVDTQNLTIAGFSGLFMNGTNTLGTAELAVIDLGLAKDVTAIIGSFVENFNDAIIDSDISDNTSSTGSGLTIEFRADTTATGLAAKAYSAYQLGTDIASGTFNAQFIQAKLTFNR